MDISPSSSFFYYSQLQCDLIYFILYYFIVGSLTLIAYNCSVFVTSLYIVIVNRGYLPMVKLDPLNSSIKLLNNDKIRASSI